MTKITATLRNVTRYESGSDFRLFDHLSGEIVGDTRMRFRDGERVSTSPIVSVDGDTFTTRNSVYKVESWAPTANDNACAVAAPVGGVESPDERPGDYLMPPGGLGHDRRDVFGAPWPAPAPSRYPAPVKAECVTFWTREGDAVMSVVADGKVVDYAVSLNVLEAGARYAIERLAQLAGGRAA